MPRIDEELLQCSIYLYRNRDEALGGHRTGGSGFLVGVRTAAVDFFYAVTNSHVIRDGFAHVRLNLVGGGTDVLDVSDGPWFGHAAHDVALARVQLTANHRCRCLPESLFISDQELAEHGIARGNHVFMVGRFVNLQGKQQNTPALRFGTIAMMPLEPMTNPMNNAAPAYITEMHSISGYSGSPVFVHILPYEGVPMFGGYGFGAASFGPKLLGIDMGHVAGIVENSGMSAVVPVAALRELLHREDVADQRA